MRILHVMPHYYPAVRYGGPIRSVQGLARATAALGHEVHVYTTNVDGPGECDVPTGVPVDHYGVQVWYFPAASLGRRVFRSPALGRALCETIGSFDVVHIHYVWTWTTIVAAASARRHGVPYILAPRGMLVADLIRRRSGLAKQVWLTLFDRKNVAKAKAIHVTSAMEESDIAELGLSTRRVVVIANGVDLPIDGPASPAEMANVAPRGTGRYILFLGRVSWKKGLDRLIRALVDVPDVELIVAGYDEKDYWASVEQLARECGVSDRTQFVGGVEGDAKWALLRGAACLVLPSYNENFGMAVVEAMAVGCPVVVSSEVGLASVVEETNCGVVVPANAPAGFATAINLVLSDAGLAREMGANGLCTARARFGWAGIADRMVRLYEECR